MSYGPQSILTGMRCPLSSGATTLGSADADSTGSLVGESVRIDEPRCQSAVVVSICSSTEEKKVFKSLFICRLIIREPRETSRPVKLRFA